MTLGAGRGGMILRMRSVFRNVNEISLYLLKAEVVFWAVKLL